MRTIQVVNVRWYNATAWYGVTLAHALARAGHPSIVVGLAGTEPLRQARELGLETVALPLNSLNPLTLAGLWRNMNGLVQAFRPDVVNCHRGEAFALWALLKRRHPFALVRTRGDQRPPKNTRVNRWLHQSAADAVIATNSAMARHFEEALGVPRAKLGTILGGVDTVRFAPDRQARAETRARLGVKDDDILIGLVGRLDEVKGVAETIHALGRAVRSGLPGTERLRLLLIGFPSQYGPDDVARWTAEAGLCAPGPMPGETPGILDDECAPGSPDSPPSADASGGSADGGAERHDVSGGKKSRHARIILTGRVDRPEEYINALDLGVVASLGSEAIARAALEIMACGVPLVSSRVGVMPDLLPDSLLFPPGNVEAMAAFLEKAPDAAWREGAVCRERVEQGLSLDGFRDSTLAVYHLARNRAG